MVVQEHLLCCNYSQFFENLFVLATESNDFNLKTIESLLIAHDKPHQPQSGYLLTFRAVLIITPVVIKCFITS